MVYRPSDIDWNDVCEAVARALHPTGVPFVDEMLNGGIAAGEVNGILGPFGQGKTMLACMLAAAWAQRCADDEAVYFVTFEPGEGIAQARAASYATGIPYERFLNVPFSRALLVHGLTPEQYRYLPEHLCVLGRRDVHTNVKRGKPTWRERGIRGVSERVGQISDQKGQAPSLVIVDYVGAMAHHAAAGDEAMERRVIRQAPKEARDLIARPFDCAVWLVHQLAGEENDRAKRGYLLNADAASECAGWARRLDHVVVLGQQHGELQMQRIQATGRRLRTPAFRYMRLRGDVVRYVGAEDDDNQQPLGAPDPVNDNAPLSPDDLQL